MLRTFSNRLSPLRRDLKRNCAQSVLTVKTAAATRPAPLPVAEIVCLPGGADAGIVTLTGPNVPEPLAWVLISSVESKKMPTRSEAPNPLPLTRITEVGGATCRDSTSCAPAAAATRPPADTQATDATAGAGTTSTATAAATAATRTPHRRLTDRI